MSLSHVSSTSGRVIAYVAYWDQGRGFASVERNRSKLTGVSPWWYSLDWAGDVVPQDSRVTNIDLATVQALRAKGVQIMPTISNHRDGAWDNNVVGTTLADPVRTEKHVQSIVDLVVRKRYDGIDIDYENLSPPSRAHFSAFLGELSKRLHRKQRLLSVSVHPKTSDQGVDGRNIVQDFAAIGAAADEVRVMSYDYHWATSEPGPVAPLPWVEQVIAYTVRHVPSDKVVIGIPLFGYDWADGNVGRPITWEQAQALADRYEAAVKHDAASGASWFTYTDEEDGRHTVWFEETDAMTAKLRLARSHGLAGVFLWRLGGESPATWQTLRPLPL